jgi:YD repeat-containing protein
VAIWRFAQHCVALGRNSLAGLLIAAALLLPQALPAHADNAQYFYDPGGRLIGMIDAANGSATYNYDQAGNITSISRTPSTTLGVVQVFPATGQAGTSVTISGTAFVGGTTTVKFFNNKTATPTSVTANSIVVPVPTGATTGVISISTSSPAASISTVPFTVASPAAVPTITSFSPAKQVQGSPVTITGTNFDTANSNVWVNGQAATVTAATTTSLTITVPPSSSGKITVTTPSGSATSSADLIVPPGTVTAANVFATARTTVGSPPKSLQTGASGTVSMMLFDVTAGQKVTWFLNDVAIPGSPSISVQSPNGAYIVPPAANANSFVWLNPIVLAQAGTYSVVWAPSSTAGTVAATLFSVPADPTATVPIDGSVVRLSIGTPGQKGIWTFSGTASQKVTLRLDFFQMYACSTYEIKNPDGSPLVTSTHTCSQNAFTPASAVTLPQTGTYTVTITPDLNNNTAIAGRGTYGASVFPVPADTSATITIGGDRAKVATTIPGQNAAFTFTGSASQNVIAQLDLNGDFSCMNYAVLYQNGSPLVAEQQNCGGLFIINNGVLALSATAQTYKVTLKPILSGPYSDGTGTSFGVVLNVPPDPSAVAITVDGPTSALIIPNAGQHASYSFTSAVANKKVNATFDFSAMTTCNTVSIKNGATTVFGPTNTCADSFSTGSVTLPTAGANTIVVSPILNSGDEAGWITAGTGTVTTSLVTVP